MDYNMKISLVIRTLNEEKHIDKCLTAVLSQTRLPDEVLLIDNNSHDKTVEIAKKYQDKLNLKIYNNPNNGYVSGLNMGADKSRYEVIGFLSADCYPQISWLDNLLKVMKEKNSAVVMGSEDIQGDTDIHFVLQATRKKVKKDKKIIFFENSNIIYKKEILQKLLPFIGIGEKNGGEDTLLSLRCHRKGYLAMKASQAIVMHSVYDNMADFASRTRQQGARLGDFFYYGWRYPRVYLNPFYWSIVEFLAYFKYFDKRFLKISFWRLRYILQGMVAKK